MKRTMHFEEAMDRLEEVVQQLESGKAPLEETMKLYQEGVKLTAFCYRKLQTAEQKVQMITDGKNDPAPAADGQPDADGET